MTARIPAFVGVGCIGFAIQIGTLLWLTHVWHWSYLPATAVAVEAAIVHNFFWHEHWTWGDRQHGRGRHHRFLRFHLGTGLTSIAGNIIVTAVAVEALHLPALVANAGAVALTSVANFRVADRWVFSRPTIAVFTVAWLAFPRPVVAAPGEPTIAAWKQHIAITESTLWRHDSSLVRLAPDGRSLPLPGGTIHEWRGSVVIRGITVPQLVQALEVPGLPPPADDILDARVMHRSGDTLHVFLRLTRSAVMTVTYDTEHDVTFTRLSPWLVTSRSISTSIRETGGADHGFLWRLNSYWRYRQQGNDVVVDVLSVSLSRDIPSLVRPVATRVIDRVARESMRRSLDAVERFGTCLGGGGDRRLATACP
jgi:putative flippase GtrA